ncbi:hypothetical protein ACET3Z_008441 [Daucus carota]
MPCTPKAADVLRKGNVLIAPSVAAASDDRSDESGVYIVYMGGKGSSTSGTLRDDQAQLMNLFLKRRHLLGDFESEENCLEKSENLFVSSLAEAVVVKAEPEIDSEFRRAGAEADNVEEDASGAQLFVVVFELFGLFFVGFGAEEAEEDGGGSGGAGGGAGEDGECGGGLVSDLVDGE